MNGLMVERHEQKTENGQKGPHLGFSYQSGDRPLEGYSIKRGLGAGGFGEVYYAVSDGGKEVALKLVQRHLDVELRGVSQCLNLKHPNLVTTFDVRQTESGESWIVMEYLAGDNLQGRVHRSPNGLPIAECLHWMAGIAGAVDYLHQHGIVHRDLKPANIFGENGIVKLGDYGLSKFISTSRRSGHTESVGTVHYMAPEISTGNYGRGIDIYAAAVIAYELFTGAVPFDGETAGEILMKHLTAAPDLSLLSPQLRPIFEKALAKKPEDRYDSVGEFFQQIKTIVTPVAAREAAPTAMEPPPMPTPIGLNLLHSLPPMPGTPQAKRRAVSDYLWTLFVAAILSSVLPLFALTYQIVVLEKAPALKEYVSMATVTTIASWGMLSLASFWNRHKPAGGQRRMHMLFLGLGVGAAAFLINAWLHQSIAERIYEQTGGGLDGERIKIWMPTILAYLSLFGAVFFVPDWSGSLLVNRREQFSLWRVIWPTMVAMVLASFFMNGPGRLWLAGVIAMTCFVVQWVCPHEPQRRKKGLGFRR